MAKVKIEGNASGTGTFTIAAPNSNSDRTLTLPDEAGTVLTNTYTSNVDFKGGDISFYEDTGTTAKFFWDASAESLGIGLSSNLSGLNVNGAVRSQNSASNISYIGFTSYTGTSSAGAMFSYIGGDARNTGYLTLNTNDTERMRITSSGQLFVNTTSAAEASEKVCIDFSSNTGPGMILQDTTIQNTATFIGFHNGSSRIGAIVANGTTGVSYNTSSDYRLKEDWQPMSGSIDRLKALNPVNFAWKVDGSRVDGFLAHEAAEVVPEAVSGEKDAMRTEEYEVTPAVLDDDGNVVTEAVMGTREVPDYQGIDQSKLVPLLTAALQEAVSKIEALEIRIAALEA